MLSFFPIVRVTLFSIAFETTSYSFIQFYPLRKTAFFFPNSAANKYCLPIYIIPFGKVLDQPISELRTSAGSVIILREFALKF